MSSILNLQPSEAAEYNNSPNCWQCRHFAISWEPAAPYMCSLMGFKSRLMPSIEVLRADGRVCRGFIVKANQAGQNSITDAGVGSTRNNSRPTALNSNASTAQGVTSTSKTFWSA